MNADEGRYARYRGAASATNGRGWECLDCAALVVNKPEHDQFHAILNDQARAIACLLTAHLGEKPHAKYDVNERIWREPVIPSTEEQTTIKEGQ